MYGFGYNPGTMGYQGFPEYVGYQGIPNYSYYHSMTSGNSGNSLAYLGLAGATVAAGVVVANKLLKSSKAKAQNLTKVAENGKNLDTLKKVVTQDGAKSVSESTLIGKLAGYVSDAGKFLLSKSTLKYGAMAAIAGIALLGIYSLVKGKDNKSEIANYNCNIHPYVNPYNANPYTNAYNHTFVDPLSNPYIRQFAYPAMSGIEHIGY